MSFGAHIEPDQKRCYRLDGTRVRERPSIDIAATRNCLNQRTDSLPDCFGVTANDHITVNFTGEVGQHFRGNVMKSGSDLDPGGNQLGTLLGGRSSPHAEHATGTPAHRRFQRHSYIDEQ